MIPTPLPARLKGHRSPRSVIGYAVWLYLRFTLSLRDVEDILAERGIRVSHETIRVRCRQFGPQIAAAIRRDRSSPADRLRSYGTAIRELCPDADRRQHKRLHNGCEASHRHNRRKEKVMGRVKSARQAQMLLSAHDQTAALFRPKRHRLGAIPYRHARAEAFSLWTGMVEKIVA